MTFCRYLAPVVFGTILVSPAYAADAVAKCANAVAARQIFWCTLAIESPITTRARRAQAYDNRGIAYAHDGQSDRALADFNEAIRLAPDNVIAYH
jgi:Flp pilus assembly protein TadD